MLFTTGAGTKQLSIVEKTITREREKSQPHATVYRLVLATRNAIKSCLKLAYTHKLYVIVSLSGSFLGLLRENTIYMPSRLLERQHQREMKTWKRQFVRGWKSDHTYNSKNLGQSFLGRHLPFLYVLQFALKKHKLAFRFAVKKGRND